MLDAAGYAELRAEQAARRERGDAVQLGIGVSVFVEITGGGAFKEDAAVEVHPDGTVTVLTGTSPHGQGHATAWAMLASEHLGIPVEKITVMHGDTDLVPRGGGHHGLAQPADRRRRRHQAAGELVELAKQRAAELLEADRRRPRGRPGRGSSCAAPDTGGQLRPTSPAPSSCASTRVRLAAAPTFPFGAHVAVVEVDAESGKAWSTRSSPSTTPGPCSTR